MDLYCNCLTELEQLVLCESKQLGPTIVMGVPHLGSLGGPKGNGSPSHLGLAV